MLNPNTEKNSNEKNGKEDDQSKSNEEKSDQKKVLGGVFSLIQQANKK